jgi:Peptidase family U32
MAMSGADQTDTRAFLSSIGLPPGDPAPAPDSTRRFPDGAAFRIEIPSTEGPRCFEAVLEEAARLDVPVRRVSQGSGALMLTDAELDEMAAIGAAAGVEVSLFAQPIAAWTPSASARAEGGAAVRGAIRGTDGLVHAIDDVRRAAAHGIRSVLLTDVGLLAAFGEARRDGLLPRDMQAKISVSYPVANAGTARVLVDLGANTLNLVTDLSVAQIAAIRAVVNVPIDLYVEAPDDQGGFVRYPELPELIRVASPVYVKLGLRNAPNIYPSGGHLESTAIALGRERVRRARLAIELLARSGVPTTTSDPGAEGLAVPVPTTSSV